MEDREELNDAIPSVISVTVSGKNEKGKIPSKCKQGAATPAAAECRGSSAGPGPMDKEKLDSGSGHELRKPEDTQQLLWLITFTLVQLQELKNIFQLVPYPDVLGVVSSPFS
ncbi:uncharacterized protein LOC115898731 isoform X2 [Rhinopithecus roxellana]|uniref:uncharacterized protein LOC115898731 isoform X2 n=1 Tax=Rhinopithecus roxellana TaxID=61622 RepID=UPI00123799BB|nr:uncharacterized protein LOC115898731 isoform X2 [Rhinopithecus roxellana]